MNNLSKDENRENEMGLPPSLKTNPFSVPQDYFQKLEKSILLNTKISNLSKSAFSTPSAYQSQLTNNILARVSEEKLKSSISEDGFIVPENYFNKVTEEILQKTVFEPKVVPIKKSKTAWIAYASAACVAIAVSMFALFPQTQSNDKVITNEQVNIDVLPTEDIINYLAFYSETGDLIPLSDQLSENSVNFTDSFSSDEIESYLENSI